VWQKIITEPVDVLKVSHHGSKDGTTEELLEVLKPKVAVISVGSKNRYGHPTKEVLDRLKERGIEVKRTDRDGEVHVMDVIDN
jgi:competence protein ComEC